MVDEMKMSRIARQRWLTCKQINKQKQQQTNKQTLTKRPNNEPYGGQDEDGKDCKIERADI